MKLLSALLAAVALSATLTAQAPTGTCPVTGSKPAAQKPATTPVAKPAAQPAEACPVSGATGACPSTATVTLKKAEKAEKAETKGSCCSETTAVKAEGSCCSETTPVKAEATKISGCGEACVGSGCDVSCTSAPQSGVVLAIQTPDDDKKKKAQAKSSCCSETTAVKAEGTCGTEGACGSEAVVVEAKSSCCSETTPVKAEGSCCSETTAVKAEGSCCSETTPVKAEAAKISGCGEACVGSGCDVSCTSAPQSGVVLAIQTPDDDKKKKAQAKSSCCSETSEVKAAGSCCSETTEVKAAGSCCSETTEAKSAGSCCSETTEAKAAGSCCSGTTAVKTEGSCCNEAVAVKATDATCHVTVVTQKEGECAEICGENVIIVTATKADDCCGSCKGDAKACTVTATAAGSACGQSCNVAVIAPKAETSCGTITVQNLETTCAGSCPSQVATLVTDEPVRGARVRTVVLDQNGRMIARPSVATAIEVPSTEARQIVLSEEGARTLYATVVQPDEAPSVFRWTAEAPKAAAPCDGNCCQCGQKGKKGQIELYVDGKLVYLAPMAPGASHPHPALSGLIHQFHQAAPPAPAHRILRHMRPTILPHPGKAPQFLRATIIEDHDECEEECEEVCEEECEVAVEVEIEDAPQAVRLAPGTFFGNRKAGAERMAKIEAMRAEMKALEAAIEKLQKAVETGERPRSGGPIRLH